jgi:hypothetical protein
MPRSRSLLSVALGALLLVGVSCSSSVGPEDAPGTMSFETLARSSDYETVAKGQDGGYDFTERQNIVFESQEDFASFWEALHGNASDPPPAPSTDFAADTRVVAVLFGTQPTGGYSIEVNDVERSGDEATVHTTETAPGAGCVVTQALTSPYHVIEVSNVPAEGFTFESTRQKSSCE